MPHESFKKQFSLAVLILFMPLVLAGCKKEPVPYRAPLEAAPAESTTMEEGIALGVQEDEVVVEILEKKYEPKSDADTLAERKENDSKRKDDIHTILNVIYQAKIDSRGASILCLMNGVDSEIPACGSDNSGAVQLGTHSTSFDCSGLLVPDYLEGMPKDPSDFTSDEFTGYFICKNEKERISILAPYVEVNANSAPCINPLDSSGFSMCLTR